MKKLLVILSSLVLLSSCGGGGSGSAGTTGSVSTTQVTVSLAGAVAVGALQPTGTIPANVQTALVDALSSNGTVIVSPPVTLDAANNFTGVVVVPNGQGVRIRVLAYDAAGQKVYEGVSLPQNLNGIPLTVPVTLSVSVSVQATPVNVARGGTVNLIASTAGASPTPNSPLIWNTTGGVLGVPGANGGTNTWIAPAVLGAYRIEAHIDPYVNPDQDPSVFGSVTVNVVNQSPIALADTATTSAFAPVVINVLANDSDPDADPLTVVSTSNPANGSAVVSAGQINYTPAPGFVGTDSFSYTISDGFGGSATATVTVTVNAIPVDVSIAEVVSNPAPASGSNVTFTITATNNSLVNVPGVSINDTLPVGLSFVSATPSQGSYVGGVWSVGTLAVGAPATLTIVANVLPGNGGSTLINTASLAGVGAGYIDAAPANDTAVASIVPVASADVGVTKSVAGATTAGATVTYTLNVNNAGPDTTSAVTVTDTLPAGLAYVSDSGGAATTVAGNTVTWNIPSLVSGAGASLSVRATIGALSKNTVVSNTASVTVLTADPVAANNSASVNFTVGNALPVITAPATNPYSFIIPEDSPTVSFMLSAVDANGDPLTFGLAGGAAKGVAGVTPVAGGALVSYTPTLNANGADAFSVFVNDPYGSSNLAVNVTITPVNDAPVFAAPPSITGVPSIGQTLTVNALATDVDLDPIVYTYQWRANGVNIPGATGTTLLLTPTQVNASIDVVVVADDQQAQPNSTVTATTAPVTALDTTAPVITLNGINPVTIAASSVYVDAGATASDNVDGNVTASIVTVNNVNTAVPGIYTVTYDVSDAAGNVATTVTRTVQVIDQTPPVITLLGTDPYIIPQNAVFNDPGTTVTDNVDVGLIASVTGVVNTAVVGSYVLTYNAADAAGNAAVPVTRTVIVNNAPVAGAGSISFQQGVNGYVGTHDAELRQDTPDENYGINATITIDGATSPTNASQDTYMLLRFDGIFGPAPGQIPVAATISSASLQLYMTSGGNDVDMIQMPGGWNENSATWTSHSAVVNGGTLLRTLQGRPVVGSPLDVSFSSPVFNVTPELQNWSGGTANFGWGFKPTSTLSTDGVDFAARENATVSSRPLLTVNYLASQVAVKTAVNSNLTITLGGLDVDGNPLTTNIVSLPVSGTLYQTVDGVSLGAAITGVPALVSNVSGKVIYVPAAGFTGQTSFSYLVNDGIENSAPATVVVHVDTVAPVITMLGTSPYTVALGTAYVDAGATASDNVDGNVTASIVTVNNVNTAVPGIYTVTYDVTDAAGNPASQVVRTVKVNAPPVAGVQTLTFQQGVNGYTGGQDTEISRLFPTSNFGAQTFASSDGSSTGINSMILMQFGGIFGAGQGQIPPASNILKADLQVRVASGGHHVDMMQMQTLWNESTATWNSDNVNVSTNATFLRRLVGRPIVGSPLDVSGLTQVFDVYTELSNWSNGAPNYGWGFMPFDPTAWDGTDFNTKEYAVVADRPKLTVTYQPASIVVNTPVNANATITLGGFDVNGDVLTSTISALPVKGALFQTPDGVTLGAAITVPGTLVSNAGAQVIYVPNPALAGGDSFAYTVSDGVSVSPPATVTINHVNTPPVFSVPVDHYASPGSPAVLTVQPASPYDFYVQAFDPDVADTLTFSIYSYPGATVTGTLTGPVVVNPYTAVFTYVPNVGTITDTFTLQVSDPYASDWLQTNVTVIPAGFNKIWTGAVDTSWGNANNWSPVGVPTTDNVYIPASPANQPVVFAANQSANSVKIEAGATLTLQSDSLTVFGTFTNNGTINFMSGGLAPSIVSAAGTLFNNGLITTAGSLIGSGLQMATVNTGTIIATNTLVVSKPLDTSNGTIQITAGKTLHISGTTLTIGAGTAFLGAGTLDVKSPITGSTLVLNANLSLPTASGVQMAFTGSSTINGTGVLTNNGSLDLTNDTINVSIVNSATGSLVLSGTTLNNTLSNSGVIAVNGASTVNGLFTSPAGASTVQGNGSIFTLNAGVNVSGMTVDNTPLIINTIVPIAFDNVTFQNFTAGTELSIGFSNATLTWNNLQFLGAPTFHIGGSGVGNVITFLGTNLNAATAQVEAVFNGVNTLKWPNVVPVIQVNLPIDVYDNTPAVTITQADLYASDVDNTAAQLVYTLTSVPALGQVRLNGVPLGIAGTFTQADINAGLVTYLPPVIGFGAGQGSFAFTLTDGISPLIPGNFTINVVHTNFPPVIDAPASPFVSYLLMGQALDIYVFAHDPNAGDVLSYSASPTSLLGSIATIDTYGHLTYTAGSSGLDTFTVTVTDNLGAAAILPVKVWVQANGTLGTVTGKATSDGLGESVAGAGDLNQDGYADIIVGAPFADPGGAFSAGSAYVYSGADASLLYTFNGAVGNDTLGGSVAAAGDVNQDGYADVIVGAKGVSTPYASAGAAYVYSGANGALLYTFNGAASSEFLGISVAGAGDVNQDGYADVIVGANGVSTPYASAGAAYVYSGVNGALLYAFHGSAASAVFGAAVAGAGDVNQDGYADVIVGATGVNTPYANAGAAYVYSGVNGALLYTFNGAAASEFLGNAVAGAGDVNQDGYADVIVGADSASGSVGKAYIYSGADGGLLHVFTGGLAGVERLGGSVAGIGDVNQDGYADVIVGAKQASPVGLSNAGSAYVYSGVDGSLLWIFNGKARWDYFGASVDGAGDLNADGYADIIVGATGVDSPYSGAGAAYVFYGPFVQQVDSDNDGLSDTVEVQLGTNPNNPDTDGDGLNDFREVMEFHTSPLVGDTDGDGFTDFTEVGAPTGALDPNWIPTYQASLVAYDQYTQILDPTQAWGVPSNWPSQWPAEQEMTAVDDGVFTARLPWPVTVYGKSYGRVVLDSNGSVWFAANASSQFEFPLGLAAGQGPVIAALNNDLGPDDCWGDNAWGMNYDTVNDRVVISWNTDSITDRWCYDSGTYDLGVPVSVVIDRYSNIEVHYHGSDFTTDAGSGLSLGDGADMFSITQVLGNVNDLVATAVRLTPPVNYLIDSDGDGLPDFVETNTGIFVDGGDTGTNPFSADWDGDGLNDGQELTWGSDPFNADSDGDTLSDGYEINILGTDPTKVDSDGDGLQDNWETLSGVYVSGTNTGTSPILSDTDGDGLSDGIEIPTGIFVNPLDPGTDPNNKDSDGDGAADADEIQWGFNPVVSAEHPYIFRVDGVDFYDQMGMSVDIAGDINGDGYADVIVGATGVANPYVTAGASAGAAYIYSAYNGTLLQTIRGGAGSDNAGQSVAGIGDINGDGYADIAVGMTGVDNPYSNGGAVQLLSGRTASVLSSLGAPASLDMIGQDIASIGDINKDGYADYAVSKATGSGGVLIYSGADQSVIRSYTAVGLSDNLGLSIAAAGDVNGDTYGDILIGAPGFDTYSNNGGIAYLYSGADGALLHTFGGVSAAISDGFGQSVAGVGDVNGDGYADVMVGVVGDDTYASNAGAAHVYSGVDGSIIFSFYSLQANARFGQSVAGGVDMNGDGIADFVVGASSDIQPTQGIAGGAVHVYSGVDGSLLESRYSPLAGGSQSLMLGYSLAVGDMNNDGYGDIAVGAPGVTINGLWNRGAAFVIDGPFGKQTSKFTLSSDRVWVPADGASSITLTATLLDAAGTPLNGVPVQFSVGGSAVASASFAITNAAGQVTVTLADAVIENVVVDAYVPSLGLSTALNGSSLSLSFLDPFGDPDLDGLNNAGEFVAGTDPNNPDTDGDGLSDGVEVNAVPPSNPLDPVSIPLAMTPPLGPVNTAGGGPVKLVAGNFIVDGYTDVAVVNQTGNTVSIFAGDGTGAWTLTSTVVVGSKPVDIAAGDLNQDGYTDLAVANQASHDVYVMLGDGAGGFVAQQVVALATTVWPESIAIGDFNIDGYADLAVGVDTITLAFPSQSSSVNVYQGGGAGTSFTNAATVVLNAIAAVSPLDLAVADFNHDGYTDIGGVLAGSNQVVIASNNGGFSFTPVNVAVDLSPRGLAVGDINHDGYVDVVTANAGANNVSLLVGNGPGFNPYTNFGVGISPYSVAIADISMDGKLDIVVGNSGSNNVSVLFGNDFGSFQSAPASPFAVGVQPMDIVVAQVDTDAAPDIVVADFASNDVYSLLNTTPFTASVAVGTPLVLNVGNQPQGLATADFNHDGWPDIATANVSSQTVSVVLSNGLGGYWPAQTLTGLFGAQYVAAGDINHDGWDDLVVSDGSSHVHVFMVSGGGAFSLSQTLITLTTPLGVELTDLNRDGYTDIVVAENSNFAVSVSFFLGDGLGGFSARTDLSTVGFGPWDLKVADINFDGQPDILVTTAASNSIAVLLGNGYITGTTTPIYAGAVNYSCGGLVCTGLDVGDVNRDGYADLVVTNRSSGSIGVLKGNGDGTFQVATTYMTLTDPYDLKLADVNRDGKVDIAVAGWNGHRAGVMLGDGAGGFSYSSLNTYYFGWTNNAAGIDVIDINHDGWQELITTVGSSTSGYIEVVPVH